MPRVPPYCIKYAVVQSFLRAVAPWNGASLYEMANVGCYRIMHTLSNYSNEAMCNASQSTDFILLRINTGLTVKF